ncbi:MAG TPA: uracil-DNA glycosylase [Micropepsaceae bacterium]|nr:uracil-DNA glycosylase [Micropepsaceae bacterium]
MTSSKRTATTLNQPGRDCDRCPRLCAYRARLRADKSDWHNAPVPSFGALDAALLIVGLAPGVSGANRTGRPFTGDYAGDLLYATLAKLGATGGHYAARTDDGFALVNVRITNAVRCVPPENKPETAEIRACNDFLRDEMAAMPRLRAVLSLGKIAHDAVLRARGLKLSAHSFAHGAVHDLKGVRLVNSYHCSRYNTNTGVLTAAMFEEAVSRALAEISRA